MAAFTGLLGREGSTAGRRPRGWDARVRVRRQAPQLESGMQIACSNRLVYRSGPRARSIIAMNAVKDALGKLAGVLMLAGIVYGLFAIVTVPIEMSKKAAA